MTKVYKEIEAPIGLHIVSIELLKKRYRKFMDSKDIMAI